MSESTTEEGRSGAIVRIPLDIVVTATGATTSGVIVAVMAADLDASEARAEAAEAVVDAAWLYAMDDTPAVDHFQRIEDLVEALRAYSGPIKSRDHLGE